MSAEPKQPIQWIRITDDSLPEVGDIVWYSSISAIKEVTPSMSRRTVREWAHPGVFYFMRVGRPE